MYENHKTIHSIFYSLQIATCLLSGIRISEINDDRVEASVRLRWINQNPFRSLFWAVQGMAAELTTGALLMREIEEQKTVSMLVIETKASFQKSKRQIRFM